MANPTRRGARIEDVEFHSDGMGYRNSHPAVNVKYHGRWDFGTQPDDIPDNDWEHLGEMVFECACETFWEDVEELARERGYDGVFSEGRSGGWCVPYYQSRSSASYQGMNYGKPGTTPDWAGPIRYPNFDRDGRDDYGNYNLGEISRFLAFARRVEALLAGADDYMRNEMEFRIDEYRNTRAHDERARQADEARTNHVEFVGVGA